MADYKHGEMDITEQKKTFEGFVDFALTTGTIIVILLVLLALING